MLRKLLLLAIFAAGGCAHGPAAVSRMDATKIQEVSDYRLCDAAAVKLDLNGRRYPVIENEIARRGISCAGHIAAVVNDCSRLQVLNSGIDKTGQGVIFTVRNDNAEARNFRIRHEGRQSRLFTIGPAMTERFGITADPNVPWLGEPIETVEGDGDIELLECRTVLGAYRMQYRPQAGSVPSAVSATASQTSSIGEGTRRRATRNVNMRAGPGTNHAIVRTLRAGEEVVVLKVVGAWCECMAEDGTRAYVSCSFLSSPPGGRASSDRPGVQLSGTPVPSFRAGTPYPQVRQQLIRGGWIPYRLQGSGPGCAPGDGRCRGFSETAFCSGVGRATCIYTWRRGTSYLLIHAVGEMAGQEFDAIRECGALVVNPAAPQDWWTWCRPAQIAPRVRALSAAPAGGRDARGEQIRLTAIWSVAGGSNCSLFLDSNLRTLVGEWEYGEPYWTVGLNGRSLRLQVGRTDQSTTRLSAADGSVSVAIERGPTLRASNDPTLPSKISRVTVRVTKNGRSSALPAYQSCGEG